MKHFFSTTAGKAAAGLLLAVLVLLAPLGAGAQALRGTFAGGRSHSLAIHADGSLWATGDNTYGQLGTGTTTSSTAWVQVGTATDWVQVAAGTSFSLGLRADGTAWAWGFNGYGQLGDNSTTDRLVPTAVSGGGTYAQLAAGYIFSVGLRTDGTVYAWGLNTNGQLGDGTTTDRAVPTREATNGTTWTALAPGLASSFTAVRTVSGYNFASTGYNSSGQLGDGTTDDANRFDRVSPLNSLQPLPVELVAFAAVRTGPAAVALAWHTASEQHNAGFTVEKSADGVAFAALGFVAGAGSSATAHAYAYPDANARAAAYYRLAQRDLDGTVAYSPVQFVPAADGEGAAGLVLVLVPNPAHGGVVQVPGLAAGTPLAVYDGLGRLVRPAAATLDVAGLPAGVYVVRAGTRAAHLVVE
ncbi:T9SS type A sorting domain-containing protein [Hymenobacter ruricola]|uniref:T9SS type A sorting domain-containing protein n=1 Tax=Hymenobacter ruricola TaxID=2791023 RepID=A0ABS0I9B7_9BACT|nr:T9SS type A sorting domain-containing protein [Hymenobacter ruricola]MBF9223172.1 T9SS type A sorting domain-containing protein [Hymenobacter ruricola]